MMSGRTETGCTSAIGAKLLLPKESNDVPNKDWEYITAPPDKSWRFVNVSDSDESASNRFELIIMVRDLSHRRDAFGKLTLI